ncbi:MAG: RNA polymerase sigma-I factor [Firmicutes bacterium]|nr:RNA polymerase sigma-I factor [Bacillota bacterium]
MNEAKYLQLVDLAQKGDHNAREKLINKFKPFIKSASCSICKRKLEWNNDDELSIALIAFDDAINTYRQGKGAGFKTYARRIINQRLIDYFRSEKRHQHIPLNNSLEEECLETSNIENDIAVDEYQQKEEQYDLAEMMIEYDQILNEYGTSLDELAEVCPKHRDTREKLVYVATVLKNNDKLLNSFLQNKRIPAKELARLAKVSKRVLENGRKYIIALVIILTDNRFSDLKSFAGLDGH